MQRFWSILFGAVLFGCFALSVAAFFIPGWWLPPLANEGSFGTDIDLLFYAILAATGFFFVLTEVILVWCMWKFTGEPGRKSVYTHGNHRLELLWTAVPAVLLLLIAFGQIPAWEKIKYRSEFPAPDQVMEVSARQFEWRMRYPEEKQLQAMTEGWKETGDKKRDLANRWGADTLADIEDIRGTNEVHTWHNANTLIYLKTRDVLHSFYLPNLRLKQDAVPGKTIPVWFKATDWNTEFSEGELVVTKGKEWELACAELCGWGHYKMQGRLYVHKDKASYQAWLKWTAANQHSREREASK